MPNPLTQHERLLAIRARPFEAAIQRWMLKRAREESARQVRMLSKTNGKWVVSKRELVSKADMIDQELFEILMRFGLAQATSAANRITTTTKAITRIIDPRVLQQELESKKFKLKIFTILEGWVTKHVREITKDTKGMVKKSIMQILTDAAGEIPQPSIGEMARRIRTTFHGEDSAGRIYAWSPERAASIVRTEINMAENTGAFSGYKKVAELSEGTDWEPRKRWLAKTDGRSGERHHEMLHNVTIGIDDTFETYLENSMLYPGDPSAPIEELANCRCSHRIVMVKRKG